MIFALHDNAGQATLTLEGESFNHLIKARRAVEGTTLLLRHLEKEDSFLYTIGSIDKRSARLSLTQTQEYHCSATKILHIGWCIIDPRSVEKVLASLVELGVTSLSFIACDRSQKNFKADPARLERIMTGAMQQSGRSTPMHIYYNVTLDDFLAQHKKVSVLDFAKTVFTSQSGDTTHAVLIGAEGGFSANEKKMLESFDVKRLNTPMVLRSETAVIAISSLLLL